MNLTQFPHLINVLLVFCGGGTGAVLRYATELLMARYPAWGFPLGTWTANVLASFVAGILIALIEINGISNSAKLLLLTGLCGGLSTFSSFTVEIFNLFRKGENSLAILYIFLSLIFTLLALFFSYWLTRQLFQIQNN